MAIGMTYEQYWYGDPMMAKSFYKAHKMRQEMQNELAWVNGLYTYQALKATVGNLMNKKTDKPNEYPSNPIDFGSKKETVKTEAEEDQEAVFAKAYMSQMVMAGKNWGKGKGAH